jgi:hypothetical protein
MIRKLLTTKFELLQPMSKRYHYLNWLSPLLVIVSPVVVAFFTSLPCTTNISLTPFQSPLHLISSVVLFSINHLPAYLFICSGLLFLCTTNPGQVTLGHRITVILVTVISVYLMIRIWSLLPSVIIASGLLCYKNLSSHLYISPQFWVYIVSSTMILLLLLNLITVIGQEKPA